jgi:hypothetical protein
MNLAGLWHELNLLGKSVAVLLGCIVLILIGSLLYLFIPAAHVSLAQDGLDGANGQTAGIADMAGTSTAARGASSTPAVEVTHVETPSAVKAVYMTACIASGSSLREPVLKTIEGTQINSVMIDVKDYTGTISYAQTRVDGPKGKGCRIVDLPQFIAELHEKHLYVIARVTVFQDPLYSLYKPDMAVQSRSHPGRPWKDKNGLAFIDPNSREYWQYPIAIAKEAHSIGFDEINFDYIRFPTDGDMSDMQFATPPNLTKADVITSFFSYLHDQLAPEGIVTSADIFGQTTVERSDMGIGQVIEDVLPYFDYVAPMTYPSHFIDGFLGYDKPAKHPEAILQGTMTTAVERAAAIGEPSSKLRPWLQAFDLGATYTPDMVKAEMQGVYNAGLTSWMLWDPANRYNKAALE